MNEPTRWSATFEVRWAPMLTYGYRRLSLLEWFEAHLDITEFHEDDHIGIAVGSSAHRLMVSESRLTLLLRSPAARAEGLEEAVAGALAILEPREPQSGTYRAAWSDPIDGDYDEKRGALARRATGPIPASIGDARDCAVLCDIYLPSGHVQADFGIVSASELRMRLLEPEVSRVASRGTGRNARPTAVPDDLPPASLFVDVSWHTHPGQEGHIESAAHVGQLLTTVEEDIAALVSLLKTNV